MNRSAFYHGVGNSARVGCRLHSDGVVPALSEKDGLPDRARWTDLKAIGIAISHTVRDGKECSEVRDYILNRYLSGKRFASAVRDHWGIENSLHWQLDVTFGENQRARSQRTRRREPQYPPSQRAESVEKRTQPQGRNQEQTAHRRLGRHLSRQSTAWQMTYGAIALGSQGAQTSDAISRHVSRYGGLRAGRCSWPYGGLRLHVGE